MTATVQFSATNYTESEGAGSATITITRNGDASLPSGLFLFITSDGTASRRSDYNAVLRIFTLPAGVTSRTFNILITDDARVEPSETVNLSLFALLPFPGVTLGTPNRATLTINDNDTIPIPANPIDVPQPFVRQHYADFLGRVPDPAGLDFWTNQITECGTNTQCVEIRRINVSAAYFLSIEFQQTGFLVYLLHQAAFDTGPLLRIDDFLPDTLEISDGVVVGATGWEQELEQNKWELIDEFVMRPQFVGRYPLSMTAEQFVDALNANTAGSLSPPERDALVNGLANGTQTRATVLRAVAQGADFNRREFNRAFVLMQYFGYLQRNPDDAPDGNLDGYNFWLGKLNQFGGNFIQAEMVKAFILSQEYRARFG